MNKLLAAMLLVTLATACAARRASGLTIECYESGFRVCCSRPVVDSETGVATIDSIRVDHHDVLVDNLTVDVFEDRDGDGVPDAGSDRFESVGRPDGVSDWFALGNIRIPPGDHVVALATLTLRDKRELTIRLDQLVW